MVSLGLKKLEEKVKESNIRRIACQFLADTTSHGLIRVADRRRKRWARYCHLGVFLVCLGFFIWYLIDIFDAYFKYDVNVSTSFKIMPLQFPAVTICNLNPFHVKRIPKDTELYEYTKEYRVANQSKKDPDQTCIVNGTALCKEWSQQDEYVEQQIIAGEWADNSTDDGPMFSHSTISAKKNRDLFFLASLLNQSALQRMLYTADELIADCSFAMLPCKKRWVQEEYIPDYGNCLIFNHDGSLKSSVNGDDYGLNMLLHVNQKSYLPYTDTAGVRVSLDPPGSYPFPRSAAYYARVGTVVSFGIQMASYSALPTPYSSCFPQGKEPDTLYTSKGFQYTTAACHASCVANRIARQCNCSHYKYPVPDLHVPPCGISNIACAYAWDIKFTHHILHEDALCPCRNPCTTVQYTVTMSEARWPAENYHALSDSSESSAENKVFSTLSNLDLKFDTLRLEIYFQTLTLAISEERPDIQLSNFLSNIGGLMGLLTGISVCTLFEFLLFFVSILGGLFRLTAHHIELKAESLGLGNNNAVSGSGKTGFGTGSKAGSEPVIGGRFRGIVAHAIAAGLMPRPPTATVAPTVRRTSLMEDRQFELTNQVVAHVTNDGNCTANGIKPVGRCSQSEIANPDEDYCSNITTIYL